MPDTCAAEIELPETKSKAPFGIVVITSRPGATKGGRRDAPAGDAGGLDVADCDHLGHGRGKGIARLAATRGDDRDPAREHELQQAVEQRILRAGEAQIDDLRRLLQREGQRLRERERAAHRLRLRRPARAQREQLHVRRDADDADAVAGARRDDPRDGRAVLLAAARRRVNDEVLRVRDAPRQLRMTDVDARVDDGDVDAASGRPALRRLELQLAHAVLELEVGIVVAASAERACLGLLGRLGREHLEELHRLHGFDARIGRRGP